MEKVCIYITYQFLKSVGDLDCWTVLLLTLAYRIRAYSTPLLIKPPLQPNLHFFAPKIHFLRLFGEKIQKISINIHQNTLKFL